MTEEPVLTTDDPQNTRYPCSRCSGRGFTLKLLRIRTESAGLDCQWHKSDCATCRGGGEIDRETYERIERGHALREARIARLESLRDAAARLGVTPERLSQIEWGRP